LDQELRQPAAAACHTASYALGPSSSAARSGQQQQPTTGGGDKPQRRILTAVPVPHRVGPGRGDRLGLVSAEDGGFEDEAAVVGQQASGVHPHPLLERTHFRPGEPAEFVDSLMP
jgi:hypothetical protein